MISVIYARSLNHCIGKDGHIPWRLPNDFKHFKATTMGAAVIMGRRTYEDHKFAFPGRLNIVVSRNPHYEVVDNIHLLGSLEDAISFAQKTHDNIFVIGGVEFFKRGVEMADTIYETIVNTTLEGDTYLPEFDFSDWQSEELQRQQPDEQHAFAFTVLKHQRN